MRRGAACVHRRAATLARVGWPAVQLVHTGHQLAWRRGVCWLLLLLSARGKRADSARLFGLGGVWRRCHTRRAPLSGLVLALLVAARAEGARRRGWRVYIIAVVLPRRAARTPTSPQRRAPTPTLLRARQTRHNTRPFCCSFKTPSLQRDKNWLCFTCCLVSAEA